MPDAANHLDVVSATPDDLTPDVVDAAANLLQDLVRDGAALGWVDPPSTAEVADLLRAVAADAPDGDAALVLARVGDALAGLGWWRRYARPTHRPHADLEKLAVSPAHQGLRVGRALVTALVEAARDAGVEVLTLDLRGDNLRAERLYASVGFTRHGLLERFVAVQDKRYDKVLMSLDLRA
ncbi:GNAT family N-acetyltransferase [Microlunatus antarcticus]|uniref:Ribosomal protein S18 acetylase RimI-like enzyme n=1 Tax=Microlunatus antarcticus TaxID=53388 RepID=A0A7W5JXA5_9ACTN|nr:ribosomal protein S18 acetylase RimI-like enzyme [Microlunatus antarcticus]